MSHDQHQPTTEFVAPTAEEINAFLPNYQVDSLLATGGMGAVYQGFQISLDRPVAIKVLPRELSGTPEFRESFQKEAKLMARLNHPNLISVYDFGEIDGMLYIAMEFVNGVTLFDAHHGEQLDIHDALKLAASICRGLENAHQAGILHRDIKPANIFYNEQGQPKIGDFGLARPSSDVESGIIYGTPGYTAPEVLKDPGAVGPATDVYSVGVLLYELITAKLPETPYQVIDPLTRPPLSIDSIIQQSLDPDPAQRYQSAGEFADAIEALIKALSDPNYAIAQKLNVPVPSAAIGATGTPSQTEASVATKQTNHHMQKKKSGLGFVKFIVILALLGGIYYTLEYKKVKEQDIQEVENKQEEIIEKINETNAETKRLLAEERNANKYTPTPKVVKPKITTFEPLPPLDIDQYPEYSKIRKKAVEILSEKNSKYYKKMESISENFLWDVNILKDRMSNQEQDAEKMNIEIIKESIHPTTFAILDVAADVSENEKINELVEESMAKQKKLTDAYEEEINVIRGHFIKHVTNIRIRLKEAQQRSEVKEATVILERAGEGARSFATMF